MILRIALFLGVGIHRMRPMEFLSISQDPDPLEDIFDYIFSRRRP